VKSFEAKYARMLCDRTLKSWAETYAASWEQWKGLTPISAIVPRVVAEIMEASE
jgi:hypothetical protein